MSNPNITEIIATTFQNQPTFFADNVMGNNALLTFLKDKGQVSEEDGGYELREPIDYAENTNGTAYSGYEVLPIAPQSTLSAAVFPWKQYAVSMTISGLEQRQNMGKNQIINLVEARMKNASSTLSNLVQDGAYSDGTGYGGKAITGLQAMLSDTPTAGTYGGIDRSVAANAYWRNQLYRATTDGLAAASASNIQTYMNILYNRCVRGVDKPDILVADSNFYGFYESSLQSIQRFTDPKMAELGFENLKFKGSVVLLENDSSFPSDHMYMLNSKYMKLKIHRDANFKPLIDRQPVNQDAIVTPIIFMGNLTSCGPKFMGVLNNN